MKLDWQNLEIKNHLRQFAERYVYVAILDYFARHAFDKLPVTFDSSDCIVGVGITPPANCNLTLRYINRNDFFQGAHYAI